MKIVHLSKTALYAIFLAVSSIVLLPGLSVRAQVRDFSPAEQDIVFINNLSEKCRLRYLSEISVLPSKNKKDFLEAYEQRWSNVKEKFDNKEIYTSPAAREYLNGLVAEIIRGNPSLNQVSFDCYFSRTYIPNASYIGEGIILFNMGLFCRLHSESEVAFVLCHEIAHFLLHHSENSITKYVSALNSQEVQSQLRTIKGSEYGRRERVQKLVKGLTFDSRRHSRDHEEQADSMSVELMRNTRFVMAGAISALELLDVIDTDSMNIAACLPKVFNAKEYPFQQKWLLKEEGMLGGHAIIKDEEMADSLKTHPACQWRIKLLGPVINRAPQAGASRFVMDSALFRSMQDNFRYESIEYAFVSKEYTRSLFLTLELLGKNPDDTYLVTQVGRVLNGLYVAQKAHTLSKVTDLPAPCYHENYNLLLQFIQNLYLEDIAGINYYFLSGYHPKMDHYSSFKNEYAQSDKILRQ